MESQINTQSCRLTDGPINKSLKALSWENLNTTGSYIEKEAVSGKGSIEKSLGTEFANRC